MRRVGRPTGLIRHTSHAAMSGATGGWLTRRVMAYSAVWLALVVAVGVVLARRAPMDVVVLRQPGTLYATLPNGDVTNFYNVQLFSRSRQPQPFELAAISPAGATLTPLGLGARVDGYDLVEGRLLVTIPRAALGTGASRVTFHLRSDGRLIQQLESSFVGPPAGGA
jgi:polyferredoxin